MSRKDTPERGREGRNVMSTVQFNRVSSFRGVRVVYTTRSKCRSWIVAFHAATFLDLAREVVGGRLRVWVAVFLAALAERLGGGGGVASNGDNEDLADKTLTSGFPVRSLTSEWTWSKSFVSGTSSESTAVSAGEFSRLSSASTRSKSTRVPPLAPEEVREDDLRRCFVARVGTLKRPDDKGASDEDTWFVGGGTLEGSPGSMSTGGERVESTKGEELGSEMPSGESEPLALRARLVRRLGLASSAAWGDSGSISLALRFLRIRPPVTGSYR